MNASGKKHPLRGWILFLTLCLIAWAAMDIFLLGGGNGEQEWGGGGLIDSPAELFPADTPVEDTPDSIVNLKNTLDDEEKPDRQSKV